MKSKLKRVYLISGLPGTGKSTLANLLVDAHNILAQDSAVRFEADQFFIDDEGQYKWDPAQIKNAHRWCQDMFWKALSADTPVVVVANTFTREDHKDPYREMAHQWAYEVVEISMDTQHLHTAEALAQRTVHGVPLDTIRNMHHTQLLSQSYSGRLANGA